MEATVNGLKGLFRDAIKSEFGPMNPVMCKFALELVDSVPGYFWTVPASSSGKHHPAFAQGEGGLARHSLMVYRWLKELVEAEPRSNVVNLDEFYPGMVVAALFHDCCKRGMVDGDHTEFNHPILAAKFVLDKSKEFIAANKEFIESTCDDEDSFNRDIGIAVLAIESHMGKWNKDKHSELELPVPSKGFQYAVHLADYLASRKYTMFDDEFFGRFKDK